MVHQSCVPACSLARLVSTPVAPLPARLVGSEGWQLDARSRQVHENFTAARRLRRRAAVKFGGSAGTRSSLQNSFTHEVNSWGTQAHIAPMGKLSLENVGFRMRSRFVLVLNETVLVPDSTALRSSPSTGCA
jgi:hypothetical protein